MGSSVDVIFLSTLRKMKFDEAKIEKVSLNLVRYNREPNAMVEKVTMPLSTRGVTVYSTMIDVDFESISNAILRQPWFNEMRTIVSTFQQMMKFANRFKVEILKRELKVVQA